MKKFMTLHERQLARQRRELADRFLFGLFWFWVFGLSGLAALATARVLVF